MHALQFYQFYGREESFYSLELFRRHADEEITVGVGAHSNLGGGRLSSCPKKLRNAQMCKRWNWEIKALKLQEKEKDGLC